MIINKIKLENIRSYLNQEINFPGGSVLLSGDIGSGKSTVLLAAEFALFGLEKGMGQGLLRNGKENGSVELHFDLEGKDVVIKRILKRSEKSVKQDSGYILINGKREEGTATELKAKILELLNYPKDYLTKGKGLLYKYTVYTPQEEMKRILLESKEDRLHVLRKIFDIDKYKRIQENCTLFLKHLRSEARIYEERLEEYEDKITEKENKEKELREIKSIFNSVQEELDNIKHKARESRDKIENFESKIRIFNEIKNELSLVNNNYEHLLREKNKNEDKLRILKNEIKDFKEENFENVKTAVQNKINFLHNALNENEAKLTDIRNRISVFNSNQMNANYIKNKIKNIDECPTCYQKVTSEYKERIFKAQDEKILEFKKEAEYLINLEMECFEIVNNNKKEIEDLRKKLMEIEAGRIRQENILKKKEEIIEFEDNLENIKEKLFGLLNQKEELNKKIQENTSLEETFRKAKMEYEEISNEEKNVEIKKTEVNEKIKFFNEIVNKLNFEIERLNALKIKLDKLKNIETWLDKHFSNLMNAIEKSIMYKLYNDFNELFKKWFAIIIDNENLKVELDEEFTPKIIQSDYDINYTDLSGGEKTAVALAYRLSLNQVLNNLAGEIKTKDLLILDEPTDGFSSEQLDRVRVVLDELNMKQIIIVSHEAKIESFVDKVLKFQKKEHVSEVF